MTPDNKSILDNRPVVDRAFPLHKSLQGPQEATAARIGEVEYLGIVGQCSCCGLPLYGQQTIPANTQVPPRVVRSCACGPQGKGLLTTKE